MLGSQTLNFIIKMNKDSEARLTSKLRLGFGCGTLQGYFKLKLIVLSPEMSAVVRAVPWLHGVCQWPERSVIDLRPLRKQAYSI